MNQNFLLISIRRIDVLFLLFNFFGLIMLIKKARQFLQRRQLTKVREQWKIASPDFSQELSLSQSLIKYQSSNESYRYFHQYFHHRCPQIIRDHRNYFSVDHRGFGEDAMHAMWWLIFLEYKPASCLEIGVYRGQVLSLWMLISDYIRHVSSIYGISPFSDAGDTISNYITDLDYYNDVLRNFSYFNLPLPTLIKSLSTDSLATETISEKMWDLIYIDGSHDYPVVLSDYNICRKNLKEGGILVLDDAALNLDYEPPEFASKGHPGPSKVAHEFATNEMNFLGSVGHNLIFEKY